MAIRNLKDIEKDIAEKKLEGIYLFYGEEQYTIQEILKKIKKSFGEIQEGINYIKIENSNIDTLIDNIETKSFFFDKKLIVVKDSGLFKKSSKKGEDACEEQDERKKGSDISKEIAEYINENMQIINENAVVIFIEENVSKYSLYKAIEKNGTVCVCDSMTIYQTVEKLKYICNQYGVKVDNSTLNYLCENVGTNMKELINEIRKLIEYAGKNGTIKKQDVDALVTKHISSIIFDLTDNLGQKKVKASIEIFEDLIRDKEPEQKILIMLYNHFKKIYITKLAQENKRDIAQSLSLKANQKFLVGKYVRQASYFKKIELQNIMKKFSELDVNSKIGLIDLKTGIEAVICTYYG